MTVSKSLTSYLLLVGACQIIVGVLALNWALPLFGDPPFLGNGLVKEYIPIRAALSDNASLREALPALRSKLEWLFARHTEGVLVAMFLGATSLALGGISVLIGIRPLVAMVNRRDE